MNIILNRMTTTGFGDIHQTNEYEIIISCIAMIAGATGMGYIIGKVTLILQEFNITEYLQRSRIELLQSYCV